MPQNTQVPKGRFVREAVGFNVFERSTMVLFTHKHDRAPLHTNLGWNLG